MFNNWSQPAWKGRTWDERWMIVIISYITWALVVLDLAGNVQF